MHQIPPLVDKKVLRPPETALALNLLSKTDLLRLKTVARIYARGLEPEGAWEDLLQIAITRVLTGSRQCPAGVSMVALIAGILRSLRTDYWRRLRRQARENRLRIDHESEESLALVDPTPGPERTLDARQQLTLVKLLFADDPAAQQIIDGLSNGLSAEQIRLSTGLSRMDYDSTRRRMRRTVLREGLRCEPK
jgi:DNA-directed RNA polymerase specialized sigma24 family protein